MARALPEPASAPEPDPQQEQEQESEQKSEPEPESEQEHEVSLTLRRVGASLIARRQSMPVRRAPLPTHPLLRLQPWLVPDPDLGSARAAASPSPAKRKCTASSRLSRILDKSAQEALEAQAPPTRFTKNFPTCPLALRTF